MALGRNRLTTLATALVAFAATLVVLMLVNRSPSPADPPATSDDAQVHVARGDALVQKARDTGDLAFSLQAEQAYLEARRLDPASSPAFTGLGTVAHTKHDFRAGLRHGLEARRLNPTAFAPFAVVVDGHIELGQYERAGRALQRMVDIRPNLSSYARVSYFRELHGDLEGALRAMRLAVAAGGDAPENVAFVQSLLGNLEFELGRLGSARRAYRTALERFPGNVPARAGLARIDASSGRLGRARASYLELYERHGLPEHAIAAAEIELLLGRTREARGHLRSARAAIVANEVENVDVELARFEADHGDSRAAVPLARRGYAAAPSVTSADTLGWALTRAGRAREGLRYAREALRLGWRDPLALYHAGVAAKQAGRAAQARRLFERALANNSNFSPFWAARARRAASQ